MSGTLVVLPRQSPLNGGLTVAGAKCFVYNAGTVVKRNTYTTSALAIANSNPHVADANGRFSPMWIDPDGGQYKLVIAATLDTDPPTSPFWTEDNIPVVGVATPRYDITPAEIAAGVTPVSYQYDYEGNVPADPRRYGALIDGTTDDTTALANALLVNRRVSWRGTLKVTSQITLADQRKIIGVGCTSDNGTRGATCLLRAFTGANPTILASGSDAGIDGIDIDNDNQGTGVCLQVTGTRFRLGTVSTRKSGGDGVRVGATEAGTSSINANLGKIDHLITLNNAGHGILWSHTNTDTTGAFPAGVPDCNAWAVNHVDARANGGDGINLANSIDNTFMNAVGQSNTGYGMHFAQYARGHVVLKAYTEGNTGATPSNTGELILDSGADNNIVLGSRMGLSNPIWTDNGAGNLIVSYNSGIENSEFVLGKSINAQNIAASGHVYYRGYPGANAILGGYLDIYEGTGTGGVIDIYVKRNGDTPVRRLQLDQSGNVVVNNAAIATTATDGFLYVPSCAGTPTGVPTTKTGMVPIVVDSTNNKLYFYVGSWRDAGP